MAIVRVFLSLPDIVAEMAAVALLRQDELRIVCWDPQSTSLETAIHNELSRYPQSCDDAVVVIASPGTGGGEAQCLRLAQEFPTLVAYDVRCEGVQTLAAVRYQMRVEQEQVRPAARDLTFGDVAADLQKWLDLKDTD